jgi:hypothetical protein
MYEQIRILVIAGVHKMRRVARYQHNVAGIDRELAGADDSGPANFAR